MPDGIWTTILVDFGLAVFPSSFYSGFPPELYPFCSSKVAVRISNENKILNSDHDA